jgi:hypothetical protein
MFHQEGRVSLFSLLQILWGAHNTLLIAVMYTYRYQILLQDGPHGAQMAGNGLDTLSSSFFLTSTLIQAPYTDEMLRSTFQSLYRALPRNLLIDAC